MELDFSRDMIEKLLFKQLLTDKNYMNICLSIFDKRWIQTKYLPQLFLLSIGYFRKYNKMPNLKLIKALAKKYSENHEEFSNMSEVNETIDSSFNLDVGADKDIISQNLKDFIRKQALWVSIIDNVEDIEKDANGVLEKCLSRFDTVSKITFNDQDLGLNFFDENDMMKHWESIANPEDRLPTGWDSVDRYTSGGLLKGGKMLGLFVAQPGLGKSLFMSNLAVNLLKQNKKVVVISLEMSQDLYGQRFDAHISQDDINNLKFTKDKSMAKIKSFYENHPNATLFIKEYAPRSIKVTDIEIYLENLKLAGYDFDIIIVDYLNLILASRPSENMFRDGLEVSEKLRALSYKFNCPVVTAAQSNTSGYNTEELGMENISESRGIAHTADLILGLFQTDDDREGEGENKKPGVIHARILKNRLGGKVGKLCSFSVNSSNLILTDITFDPESGGIANEASEADNILKNMKDISSDISSTSFEID